MLKKLGFRQIFSAIAARSYTKPYNYNRLYISERHVHGEHSKCWKCGAQQSSKLFCDKCNTIQSPRQSDNYFSVFDLKQCYDVDQKELTQKYRQMQSLLHPDKFTNSSKEEQAISDEYSSLVNKAYSTLQTPISRALHMLALHNEFISEENKSSDPEFLMTIMELNEEVEEADTEDKLRELNNRNNTVLEKVSEKLSKHFRCNDIATAKQSVIQMKYFNSLSRRINELMRERGIVD